MTEWHFHVAESLQFEGRPGHSGHYWKGPVVCSDLDLDECGQVAMGIITNRDKSRFAFRPLADFPFILASLAVVVEKFLAPASFRVDRKANIWNSLESKHPDRTHMSCTAASALLRTPREEVRPSPKDFNLRLLFDNTPQHVCTSLTNSSLHAPGAGDWPWMCALAESSW